ncbi:hypothetical protein Bca101_082517 [Brassica carinata]
MLWRRRGKHLHKDGIVIFDQYFTKTILSYWSEFEAANDKLKFEWGPNIPKYVTGKRRWQSMKLELGRDVYTVYAPMNWGGDHWVGLRIDLKDSQVMIYDSFVPHNSDEEVDEYLRPLIQSLPYILEKYAGFCSYQVKDGMRYYSWIRAEGIYHNQRGGDCGPCAAKFIEMHDAGLGTEDMSRITDNDVDNFREQYAMDCYEEFVGKVKVVNE